MNTIVVSKDSKLMRMIRDAKARKIAWQESIQKEMDEMQKELKTNQQHLQSVL